MRRMILSLVVLTSSAANAIIVRHDQPIENYAVAAEELPLPVVLMGRVTGPVDGQGVLVAPTWILTAAHIAQHLRVGASVRYEGQRSTIAAITLHPDFSMQSPTDIAVIELTTPLNGIYVGLAESAPAPGDTILIVGRGDQGDGLQGRTGADGSLLAGENLVDEVGSLHFTFDFTGPEDGALQLEAVNGGGDSGNGAFIMRDGELALVGISSGQDGMGFGPGRYGVVEYSMSIAGHLEWIREVMGGPE
jgi:Trypsin